MALVDSPSSGFRHVNRLNHALNFAHVHWRSNLSLDVLATHACLSKYHFVRLFHDYTGEAPIGFVKRLRMERAAHFLSYHGEMRITDIALATGFSSNQTFTRAFAGHYGVSPRAFRSHYVQNLEHALGEDHANRYALPCRDESEPERSDQRPRLVHRQPTRVAYFRNIGAYGISPGIDQAIAAITHWARTHGLWHEQTCVIGASWDSNRITPNTLCKYDACVPIPHGYKPEDHVSVQTLPGGRYAVLRAPYDGNGGISLIWRRFTDLLRNHPRLTGYQTNAKPCFEIFTANPASGRPEVELCIQLVPKT